MRRTFVDRRRHQRYDIDGDLTATLTSGHRLRIADLGSHGALVQTFAPLPLHSLYDGRLVLAGEECDVRFRVLHVRRTAKEPARFLMGVEFLDLAPRAVARIEALLGDDRTAAGPAVEVQHDRRRGGRLAPRECSLRVLVRVPVMMRDIGSGGALLEAPVTVPVETRAHLRTMLRGRRFETDLDVGRSEPDPRPGAAASRLGVRFTTMDEESRSALSDFLAIATERDD